MFVFMVFGLLSGVYLVINLVLPLVPIHTLIKTYIFQPILWGFVFLAIRRLPVYRPQAKINMRGTFTLLAFGIALVQIISAIIGGLFSGFGKNPASLTILGIITNIFFVGTMLVGIEMSRAWVVTTVSKRYSLVALIITAIFFSFISLPLNQIITFKMQIDSANIITSSWVPLLAENLLASLLVLIAGARASLAYRGLLAAFWWLCPILPDLSWGLKALIGAGVPIVGMVAVNSVYSARANRGKSKWKTSQATFPAGWVLTALACVIIVWFVMGVFPFKPSLIGSGSMTPLLATGDVVIIAKVPANAIKLGDVIEYRKDEHTNIVHRVISIDITNGGPVFVTKGDANNAPDDIHVLAENVNGKVVFNIRKVGMISIMLKNIFHVPD
jgi:signal peptidase